MHLLMWVDMKFSVLYIPYHHDGEPRNPLKYKVTHAVIYA